MQPIRLRLIAQYLSGFEISFLAPARLELKTGHPKLHFKCGISNYECDVPSLKRGIPNLKCLILNLKRDI